MKNDRETTYLELLEAAVRQNTKAKDILNDILTLQRLLQKAKQLRKDKEPRWMDSVEVLDSINAMIEAHLNAMNERRA